MSTSEQTPTNGVVLYSCYKRQVVRYGDKVVKSGPDLNLSEAETMQYIAQNTSIPVPKVFETHGGESPSIVMEYIDGERLDKVWNNLPETSKLDLSQQLLQILTELRGLKGDFIGSVGGGPAIDLRQFDSVTEGPFSSESEFNNFLLSGMIRGTPKIVHDIALRSLRSDHKIVFTHGDFDPRNIMVKNDRIVGLLDWEYAGWYPEYWEFVKTFSAPDHRVNWYDYIQHIFPQCYEQEYINDRFLNSILEHGST